ncbi:hypothetical protein MAR_036938 [Mya arenaria]|uniref:Uncharacterized protein n=1 Tax=Mya arenaria TaxID=6604 RepID=A0ABY7FQY6_MYAAR|nr:uncharacterized PPE family protein PPE16-like [Mya arenaria]WAR23269.1 hypothetical protein MAR_036938 [Mya arenaria]
MQMCKTMSIVCLFLAMIACAFAHPMWPRHGARQMPINILPFAPSPFIPMIPLPRNQDGAWTGNTGFGTQWSDQWTTGQNGQLGLNGQNGQFGFNSQNGQFGLNGQNGLFGLNGLNGQFGLNAQNDQFGQNAQNGQWIDGSSSGLNSWALDSQGNGFTNDLNTGTSGDPWVTYKQLNAGIGGNTQSGAGLSQQVLGGQGFNNQLGTEQWPGFQQSGVSNNGFGNGVRQNSWTGSQDMNFPAVPNRQQTGSLNQRFGTGLVNNGIPNNQATWWKK